RACARETVGAGITTPHDAGSRTMTVTPVMACAAPFVGPSTASRVSVTRRARRGSRVPLREQALVAGPAIGASGVGDALLHELEAAAAARARLDVGDALLADGDR